MHYVCMILYTDLIVSDQWIIWKVQEAVFLNCVLCISF